MVDVDPAAFVPRTALVAEKRGDTLYVFLPPTAELEEYLAIVEMIENAAAEIDDMAWMRQLLDWQREAADPGEFLERGLGASSVHLGAVGQPLRTGARPVTAIPPLPLHLRRPGRQLGGATRFIALVNPVHGIPARVVRCVRLGVTAAGVVGHGLTIGSGPSRCVVFGICTFTI